MLVNVVTVVNMAIDPHSIQNLPGAAAYSFVRPAISAAIAGGVSYLTGSPDMTTTVKIAALAAGSQLASEWAVQFIIPKTAGTLGSPLLKTVAEPALNAAIMAFGRPMIAPNFVPLGKYLDNPLIADAVLGVGCDMGSSYLYGPVGSWIAALHK